MRNLSIIKKVIVNGFSLSLLLLIGCELDPVGGYYVWYEDCQCEVHISEYEKNSDFEVVVYEKEKMLSLDEGYGIQLATNSISVLNKIGFGNIENNNIFHPLKLNFYSLSQMS